MMVVRKNIILHEVASNQVTGQWLKMLILTLIMALKLRWIWKLLMLRFVNLGFLNRELNVGKELTTFQELPVGKDLMRSLKITITIFISMIWLFKTLHYTTLHKYQHDYLTFNKVLFHNNFKTILLFLTFAAMKY